MSEQRVRSQLAEEAENVGCNPTANPTMGEIIATRYNRRDMLRGALAVTAISATMGPLVLAASRQARAATPSFVFDELPTSTATEMALAPGYKGEILIRWGDPVVAGAPAFEPTAQTAAAQKLQFGYNNDYLGYLPIDGSSEHGLLVVNHEYTNEELMFPGIGGPQDVKEAGFVRMTQDLADIEMAAHGGSVLEIKKVNGAWEVVKDSPLNRRITGSDTEMTLTGPAAGHDRLKTKADPTGTKVIGMLNNCAGGITPWGTWLSCEENINGYFWGKLADDHPEAIAFKRYGIPSNWYNWGAYYDRFDVTKEPNEANRFGWVVEIDPRDPTSTPKKRTALGRVKHEGAAGLINKDGRYVVYMGDDERFDHVYRFVTEAVVDTTNPAANVDILDKGTLSVAKYNADGSLEWMPLVHGQGPLTEANGFKSQGDVLISTRLAADALGATKMDRPEDVEANPKTGKVYVMLTNNTKRTAEQVDAANPRAENKFGHIVEMTAPDGDHAADKFTWDILVKCGDPAVAEVGAMWGPGTTEAGWFGMPDNLAIDAQGRLWVATDGNSPKATGRNDGLWAVETEGEMRGTSKHFFSCPLGAEMCGPMFAPDDKSLFLAVQHPGEEGADGKPGTFEQPATRWPDFVDNMPPRPSIVVVTKDDGGFIGA